MNASSRYFYILFCNIKHTSDTPLMIFNLLHFFKNVVASKLLNGIADIDTEQQNSSTHFHNIVFIIMLLQTILTLSMLKLSKIYI